MQVFCDLKLEVQHLLLYSRYYRSQDVASITTSIQDDGTPYVWFTLHQLHIAAWYETKYRYLNSRRVGARCSASPLEHDCWRCELALRCTYRWQARTLFRSYQYVFNRIQRHSLQPSYIRQSI